MADAEIANEFMGISVKLRCPRCHALLDISRVDARKRFTCGGCRLNTDVTDCAAVTEGMQLSPALKMGMKLIPAALAGFFFMFVESLAATGFTYWGESALAGLAGGGACGLAAAGVGELAISRDAPRAASRIVLSVLTLCLGAFLRWRLGAGSVSETMLVALYVMALFWLCMGIFSIFRVFRPPSAMQVAQVVEVDNLST